MIGLLQKMEDKFNTMIEGTVAEVQQELTWLQQLAQGTSFSRGGLDPFLSTQAGRVALMAGSGFILARILGDKQTLQTLRDTQAYVDNSLDTAMWQVSAANVSNSGYVTVYELPASTQSAFSYPVGWKVTAQYD